MGKKRCRNSHSPLTISSHVGKEVVMNSGDEYLCSCCKIIVQAHGIGIHFEGKKHRRLQKLEIYYPFLLDQGLSWMDGTPFFKCEFPGCDPLKKIQARYSALETHVKNVHISSIMMIHPPSPMQVYVGSFVPKIIHRVQHSDRPKCYWKNEYKIEEQVWEDTKKITAPVEVRGTGSDELLLFYVNAGFSHEELRKMTKRASYLDKNGERVRKGELKGGTHMVGHGFRYAYGEIGRFSQSKKPLCYSKGEKLSTMLCSVLIKLFPAIFEHMEAVREKEGMPYDVARVGGSPFTTMSVTKDYSCNPHIDEKDNSYGFFIWIGANGTKDKFGNEVKFYLPGLDCFLVPKIGDVLLLKSKDLYHCTRTFGYKGQYGIALFQNSSFFRHHAILRQKLADGVHDRLTKSWIDSEGFYGHI